jgi:large subunit ribosomal protein L10e
MFDFGSKELGTNDFDVKVGLVVLQNRRISHFTLEAIRISLNRRLQVDMAKNAFHCKVRSHPHDVYREHAMMAFAGADRLSSGMRNGFGRPVGLCARVKAGTVILECGCELKYINQVKKALQVSGNKICSRVKVVMLGAKSPEIAAQVPLMKGETFVGFNG